MHSPKHKLPKLVETGVTDDMNPIGTLKNPGPTSGMATDIAKETTRGTKAEGKRMPKKDKVDMNEHLRNVIKKSSY